MTPTPGQNLARMSRASERIMLVFFLIVALASGGRGLFELWRVQGIADQGVAGEAVMLQCSPRRGGPLMRYEYVVPDATGTPQRYVKEERYARCQQGAMVPIRYLPADPKQVLIQGASPFDTLGSYGIVTAISLVMLVWLPFSQWRKRRAEAQAFAKESAPQG